VPALDRARELVEFGGQLWLSLKGCLVAPLLLADVLGMTRRIRPAAA
jgi:hypothetical protein